MPRASSLSHSPGLLVHPFSRYLPMLQPLALFPLYEMTRPSGSGSGRLEPIIEATEGVSRADGRDRKHIDEIALEPLWFGAHQRAREPPSQVP
jgi:hypothetical protein